MLVRRLRGKSRRYGAAVSGKRQVGVVDLSKKRIYRARPRPGWTYEDFPPLTRAEQATAESKAAKTSASQDPEAAVELPLDGAWHLESQLDTPGS